MRGKVEPGALCLVITGMWTGVSVRVIERDYSAEHFVRDFWPKYANMVCWMVETTDGLPRATMNVQAFPLFGFSGVVEQPAQSARCTIFESWLMPLDPGPDVATMDELVQGFFDKHAIKDPVVKVPI